MAGRRVVRVGRASATIAPRVVAVSGVLAVVAVALLAVSLVLGDFPVPLRDVVPAALGRLGDEPGGAQFVVRTLRLPRALVAALVGAAFGLSGALLQRLTRNALASPDIIGITAGAGTGAVAVLVLTNASGTAVNAAALAGGLASAVAIYVLAWRRGVSGYRIILVGIGLTAALQSGTSYLLTRGAVTDATQALVWLTGSVNGRGWEHVVPVAIALAVLVPLALVLGHGLRALQLGDDLARGLGARVTWTRSGVVLAAVALASVATASAGPVAFVALASPAIARGLCGGGHLALVPAALTGSCVVLAADLLAQHALGGLPVGVATALVGGPYLLLLLARTNRVGVDA